MYYHVKIKSTEHSKEMDNLSHDIVMQSIAIPYLLNKQFRLNGGIFIPSHISSIKITRTEEKLDKKKLLEDLEFSSFSSVFKSIIAVGQKIEDTEDVTDDFLKQANQKIQDQGLIPEKQDLISINIDSQKLFVVSSFSDNLSQNFEAISETCKKFYLKPVRADKELSSSSIIERTQTHLKEARFVVADLTEAKPNVYYEIGFLDAICEARNIDASDILLLVAKDITNDAHFDIRHRGIEKYDNPFTLMKILEKWITNRITD